MTTTQIQADLTLSEHKLTNRSIRAICKEKGYVYSRILEHLHYRGIRVGMRGTKYVDGFFETIDTEEKAYILGMLYADGNVYTGGGQYRCKLSLHVNDRYMVEMVRDAIAKGLKIRTAKHIPNSLVKGNGGSSAIATFTNVKLVKDLIRHGCVPRKSSVIQLPTRSVPPSLMSHFLRGYFDGDGSISYSERNNLDVPTVSVGIGSSKDFCHQLKAWLQTELGINSYVYQRDPNNNAGVSLKFGGSLVVMRFMDYLYGSMGTSFYLRRKRAKYEQFMKLRSERNKPLAIDSKGRFISRSKQIDLDAHGLNKDHTIP